MFRLFVWMLAAVLVVAVLRDPLSVLSTAADATTGAHPTADTVAHVFGKVTEWSMDLLLRLFGHIARGW